MKRLSSCILLFFAVASVLWSQELPEIIPHNPEMSSLGKYGDIPVGHFTGVPNIAIPLVTLRGQGMSVPLSLSYHASGIRVGEMASRTGLGWSLSAGGALSRSMRGIPDDTPGAGYLYTGYTVQSLLDNVADQGYVLTMLNDSSEGLLDLESDVYSYNIMGYSGKFHFNQAGDIITHPDGDDTIVPVKIGDVIRGWQITTKEGVVFYLGLSKDQSREANDTSNPTGTSVNLAGGYSIPTPGTYTTDYISSWQLMELEMPSGETFSFEYQSSSIEFWNLGGQKKYFGISGTGNCFQNDIPTSYSINNDLTHRLTRISGKTGYILLSYDQPRLDLVNDFALTGVQLYNNHDQLVDQYQLEYDYFISTQHLNTNTFGNTDQRRKRLYLQRVVQTTGGTENQVHAFSYNTDHILPDRLSFAQDAWGYYNGQANSFFYPEVEFPFHTLGGGLGYVNIPGGDRKVYPEYAAACMLTSITYPTGGTTEFEFEPNSISNQSQQFFATSTLNETPVFSYNTNAMPGSEITHVIPIGANYNGGLKWQVNFDTDCADPNGFDCPRAELFFGNDTNPAFVTSGADTENSFSLPAGVSEITLKLYNYSGQLNSPENHIQVNITGLSFDQGNMLTGGFRVKRIFHKDKDGSIVSRRRYDYSQFDDPAVSSGASLFPPAFITYNKPLCYGTGDDSGSSFFGNQITANSIFPLTNGSSYSAGYTNVTEYSDENGQLGKTEYTFMFTYDGQGIMTNMDNYPDNTPHTPLHDFSYRRGGLLHKKVYKNQDGVYELVQEEQHSYIGTDNYDISSKNIVGENISNLAYPYKVYTNYAGPFYKLQQVTTTYDDNGTVSSQTTDYSYDPYPGRNFPVQTRITTSRGEAYTTKTYFPDDVNAISGLQPDEIAAISQLDAANQHRIAEAVQSETYREDALGNLNLLSTQRTLYKDWGMGLILPEKVQVATEDQPLKDRVVYHAYDPFGNPLEVSKAGGPPISYIWGYQNTRPVAKVEGLSYLAIDPTGIVNLKLLSDNDSDGPSEQALRDGFDALRNTHPGIPITGFTYDPLIGVTSISDSRGHNSFYSYDSFNRLVDIKNNDGTILQVFNYNYAQQAVVYDPLVAGINYGSEDTDHQWFTADVSGGSGDVSYAWFEGIGDSSTDFEATPYGTSDTYQLMVNCTDTKYVKLVVTDNVTGEVMEATKVNNNTCPYPALTVNVTYGTHSDTYQNFVSMVSGGSGNVTYAWYKGVGTSSFTFETTVSGTLPNYQLQVSCSTYRWVKLVVTDTVTGESVVKVTKSNNSPCSGGGGNPIEPDPFDPEQ